MRDIENRTNSKTYAVFVVISAANIPKDIFFVPSPSHGVVKCELYYALMNMHHKHMAKIWSFAISSIFNLNALMLAQMQDNKIPHATLRCRVP
jgi:hypothetical protein